MPELDPSAFGPLINPETLHGAYRSLDKLGEPLRDPVLNATVSHVSDVKPKPERSLPSLSLLNFTLPSELIPPSDLVSAFEPTYPVEPSTDMAQQVDQIITEVQTQPLIAPSDSLHEPEYNVVSNGHSVPALTSLKPETDLPVIDLQLSALDSEPKVVPPCIDHLFASATVLDPVINQPQPIPLLTSLADLEEQALLPAVDQQRSRSSPDLKHEVGLQLECATSETLQHVSSFLAQLDPQPVPISIPPVMSQQPEISLTPTDELDVTPQVDFTSLPVNGQPESELNLGVVPLVEEESKDVVQTANASKEEPALQEEVPSTCPL